MCGVVVASTQEHDATRTPGETTHDKSCGSAGAVVVDSEVRDAWDIGDAGSLSRKIRRWTSIRLSTIAQALASALRRRKKKGVLLSGSRTSMWISSWAVLGRIRGTPSLCAAAITLRRTLSEALPRSFRTRSTVEALTPASTAISTNLADRFRRRPATIDVPPL
jgi:hypothetical protein